MDTTAQNTTQNSQSTSQNTDIQTPVQQPIVESSDQAQIQQPVQTSQQLVSAPVGGKETLSIPAKPQTEWVQETAQEAKIEHELQEAGVEKVAGEVLQVTPEVGQAGIQPVGLAAPVPEEPKLKLPIEEDKAKGILKMHKKVKDSVTWLAMLVVRQMQLLRFKEKGEVKNG